MHNVFVTLINGKRGGEPATTPLPCLPLPIHRPSTSYGPTGLEEGEESHEGRPPAPPSLAPVSYVSDCFLLRSWLRTFSWSRSLVICLVCRIKTFAVRSQSTFHISCSDYSVVLFGGVLIDTVAVSGRNSPCWLEAFLTYLPLFPVFAYLIILIFFLTCSSTLSYLYSEWTWSELILGICMYVQNGSPCYGLSAGRGLNFVNISVYKIWSKLGKQLCTQFVQKQFG